MLLKVFTVLGAISLLGGLANCQTASNQNDQLMKLLMSMMGSGADATKNTNENQILQMLLNNAMKTPKQDETQMMQMLMKLIGNNADMTKNTNENQMMQLLISMMGNGAKDSNKMNENQILQLLIQSMGSDANKMNENQMTKLLTSMLTSGANSNENQLMQALIGMMGGAKDSAKSNENQLMQLLMLSMMGGDKDSSKNENQAMQLLLSMMGGAKDSSNNENQMMQLLLNMMGGAKDSTKNENQMMQLLMSMMGGAKDSAKLNENQIMQLLTAMMAGDKSSDNQLMQLVLLTMLSGAKDTPTKPAGCMVAKKMENNADAEIAAWMKMLKTVNMKDFFENNEDHSKFTDMIKFVEGSESNWLSVFVKKITSNNWLMTVGERIVDIVEDDMEMRDNIEKFVKGNKEILQFARKAHEWVKMQNFNESTPMIQKMVDIFKGMDLKDAKIDAAWYENYMSWVDCTFGKEGEIATVMKTIGMLSNAEDMFMPLLKDLIDNSTKPEPRRKMIEVTLQQLFKGSEKCGKKVMVAPQSLFDIYTLTVAKKQFCTNTVFTPFKVGQKSYVQTFGGTSNTNTFKWKIDIMNGGLLVANNVDLSYVPKHGDVLAATYTDQ